jgi:uncharacterized protein YebE (UPF0316 family)
MDAILTALLIFALRIVDVSIGTVRVIYTIRGQKLISTGLGACESFIWIFAISRAFKYVDNPLSMVGWALGFATGTFVGIALDQWIGSGSILMRVISRNHALRLRELLHAEGFGVTAIQGQGRDGNVLVIFVVAPRKRTGDGVDEEVICVTRYPGPASASLPRSTPAPQLLRSLSADQQHALPQ